MSEKLVKFDHPVVCTVCHRIHERGQCPLLGVLDAGQRYSPDLVGDLRRDIEKEKGK